MFSTELYHHGILGQKWGVRRFQNEDGSLTDAGKRRYVGVIVGGVKSYLKNKKRNKVLAEARAKRQATLAAKKQHEAEKKDALESGDPTRIQNFQRELSNDELRYATDRIRLTETLRQQSEARIQTGMDKAEDLLNKIDRVRGMAEKGINAYNTYAKVHNSFATEDNKLPTIDGKGKTSVLNKRIEKAIKSGNAEEIAKYKGKMSAQQTSDAVKTVNNWKNLEKTAAEDKKAREDAAKAVKETAQKQEHDRDVNREKMFQQRDTAQRQEASKHEQDSWDREFERDMEAGRKAYEYYKSTLNSNKSSSNNTQKSTSTYSFDSNDKASPQMQIGQEKTTQLLLEMKKDRNLYKDLRFK